MGSPPNHSWTRLTRAYLAVLAACVALFVVEVALRAPLASRPVAHQVLGAIHAILLNTPPVLGVLWLHRAWTRVPRASRRAYDDRRIEPDEAIWKLFLPLYGVYWMFLANIGLCGAVERHLHRLGARSAKAPSTLALIACLAQLVPVVNIVVSPFLWAAFMTRIDAVQAEADALSPDTPAPLPLGVAKALGMIVGALLLEWLLLIFVFLATWQFLNPGAPSGG